MRRSLVLVIGLGLGLAACSDSTGPQGDRLTRAEALIFAAQVMASSEAAAAGSLTPPGPGDATIAGGPPTSFSHTHESTHPCPSGGTLTVALAIDGTFDSDTNSLQADLEGSHTHASCAFPYQALTFTVNGLPRIGFTASVGAENGQPSQPFTFTLDGGFAWTATDGREGSCSLELDAVTDFIEGSRTVQGDVCGHTISQTTTWSTS